MGGIGGFFDSFLGTGGEGRQAGGIISDFYQQAIDEMRRQFDITQENIDPFIEAGTDALTDVIQGSTIGGLDQRLQSILSGEATPGIVDERRRATEGALASAGLRRSGTGIQELAAVPINTALGLENLVSGRATNLAGSGQNAAIGLGSLGQQNSSGIANLLVGQGNALGSGILTDAQARAQGVQNLFELGRIGASFFSDPGLKENIEPIMELGPLNLYQWDWIDEAKETIIGEYPTIGFMADEVEEKLPKFVHEYAGFKVIEMKGLLDHLEAEWLH